MHLPWRAGNSKAVWIWLHHYHVVIGSAIINQLKIIIMQGVSYNVFNSSLLSFVLKYFQAFWTNHPAVTAL